MRILLTNWSLAERGGTQLWVRDVARALVARGHEPTLYSTRLGDFSSELEREGIRVVARLRDTGKAPDLVHGQYPQGVAALAFHGASPGLFVAHSFDWWAEAPPLLRRFYRYVAVDEPSRRRLLERGAPPDRTRVLLNSVDLGRFPSRPPLPRVPRRALLFSNYAREDTYLPAVRDACSRAGLALDVVGLASGNSVAHPEEILGTYDIVFAKARCALESLATGCAVILCDAWGVGSFVTAADVDRMRPMNFGRKLLTRPVTAGNLLGEIVRYDADEAALASSRVRAVAGLDRMVDELLDLYGDVVQEHAQTAARPWAERRALATYALRMPFPGVFRMTQTHYRLLRWANGFAPFAALLSARRRLLRRLNRPGYGGSALPGAAAN